MKISIRHVVVLAAFQAVTTTQGIAADNLDELSLEELVKVQVIQTPKFAINAEFTPSSVSVLTRADIQIFGWRTLADALRSLNGYTVTTDHTYAYAGVRGIAAPGDFRNRLQLLIDGIPVNENLYGSANIDSAFPLDLGLIEQIEVIRGPSASVYGGDSALGVINVVTRSGSSLQGTELSASLGSGKASEGRISWGTLTAGGTDLLLSYTGAYATGRRQEFPEVAVAGMNTMAQGVGGEQGGKFFARAKSENWRATLIHSTRDVGVPTGSYATAFDDASHREADSYTLAEVANDYSISRKTSLHTRVYAGQYAYQGVFPYDYPPRVLNRDHATGQWWGVESRLLTTTWHGHRWIGGVEYKANIRQDQKNDDQGYGCFGVSTSACLDDRRQSQVASVYAQDEITVGDATYLTLGVRYDKQSDAKGNWSPRLGLVHQNDHGGIFKLLYATAFSEPSAYQRYYSPATFAVGNPELQAEQMRSLDFTWEQRLGPSSRLSTSLYFFRIQNLVGTSPDTGRYDNFAPVTARGLEIEFQHRWPNRATLRTGYTLQQSSLASGDLENAPHYTLHGNLAIPIVNSQWLAGLEAQALSRRRTGDSGNWVAGYGIANLNLTYQPSGEKWHAALGIYNLFDHQYADPVALDSTLAGSRDRMLQFGRSLRLKFTLQF